MTVKTKKRLPALRFPEFEGEWEEKKLSQVLKVITRPVKMEDDVEYSLVTVKRRFGGIIQRGILPGKEIRVKSQFRIEAGDFLISKRQIVHGACEIVPETLSGSIVSNEYHVLASTGDLFLEFFRWYVRMPPMKKAFFLSSHGVHIEKMLFKVDDWFKRKFEFPSLPEQQKIASFLTAIDARIGQLSRKKALLEQYKKGVMQQLFSRKIRFRDEEGKAFPEWEVKKLGEVTENFSRRNKDLIDAEVFSVTNSSGFVPQSDHFEDRKIAGEDLKSYKIIKGTEFAYNPARINVGSIAQFKGEICLISSLYVCFRVKKQLLDKFLIYFLQLESTKFKINTYGEGGVRIYLWYLLFASIKIHLPSIQEQKKIADFLLKIDEKIKLVEEEIDKTQTFKKGLLQQLFV